MTFLTKCRNRWEETPMEIPVSKPASDEEGGYLHLDKHHICHRSNLHYGICICECGAMHSIGRMLKKHSGS